MNWYGVRAIWRFEMARFFRSISANRYGGSSWMRFALLNISRDSLSSSDGRRPRATPSRGPRSVTVLIQRQLTTFPAP